MNYASITMRAARTADATAIARLVELEEDRQLTGDVLVAEADGAVLAALSIDEGRAVADIFKPTAEIVGLLRARREAIMRARRFSHAGSVERPRGIRRIVARLS